jgi:hypothetical protein
MEKSDKEDSTNPLEDKHIKFLLQTGWKHQLPDVDPTTVNHIFYRDPNPLSNSSFQYFLDPRIGSRDDIKRLYILDSRTRTFQFLDKDLPALFPYPPYTRRKRPYSEIS